MNYLTVPSIWSSTVWFKPEKNFVIFFSLTISIWRWCYFIYDQTIYHNFIKIINFLNSIWSSTIWFKHEKNFDYHITQWNEK